MRNVRDAEGLVHLIKVLHEPDDTDEDEHMYILPQCWNDGARLYTNPDDLTDEPATCLKCVAGDVEDPPF